MLDVVESLKAQDLSLSLCPICSSIAGGTRRKYTSHICQEMEEIALASLLQTNYEVDGFDTDSSHDEQLKNRRPSEEVMDGIIKCICDSTEDDGNTRSCEKCGTWQHIDCYFPIPPLPEKHLCVNCDSQPRWTAARIGELQPIQTEAFDEDARNLPEYPIDSKVWESMIHSKSGELPGFDFQSRRAINIWQLGSESSQVPPPTVDQGEDSISLDQISDPAERRRISNRVAQRSYRTSIRSRKDGQGPRI